MARLRPHGARHTGWALSPKLLAAGRASSGLAARAYLAGPTPGGAVYRLSLGNRGPARGGVSLRASGCSALGRLGGGREHSLQVSRLVLRRLGPVRGSAR